MGVGEGDTEFVSGDFLKYSNSVKKCVRVKDAGQSEHMADAHCNNEN